MQITKHWGLGTLFLVFVKLTNLNLHHPKREQLNLPKRLDQNVL